MNDDKGPVIDWMKDLLAQIWKALTDLVHVIASIPERIDAKIDRLETKVLWIGGATFLIWAAVTVWSNRKR